MKFQFILKNSEGGTKLIVSREVEEGGREFNVLKILQSISTDASITIAEITKAYNENHAGYWKKISTRTTFAIIRALREKNVPIVGDEKGLHIAQWTSEILKFCDDLEHKAKASVVSCMKLRKQMLEMSRLEKISLFDSINIPVLT